MTLEIDPRDNRFLPQIDPSQAGPVRWSGTVFGQMGVLHSLLQPSENPA